MINEHLVLTKVQKQISPLYSMYFSNVHIFVADEDINLKFEIELLLSSCKNM